MTKLKIAKILLKILLFIFLIGAAFVLFVIYESGLCCRNDLEEHILLIDNGKNYLVNLELNQTKPNKISGIDYFGNIHLANLSDKDLKSEFVNSDLENSTYNIYIKNGAEVYPLQIYRLTQYHYLHLPKDKITSYPIVASSIPENFDWNKAEIVVSDSIFEQPALLIQP